MNMITLARLGALATSFALLVGCGSDGGGSSSTGGEPAEQPVIGKTATTDAPPPSDGPKAPTSSPPPASPTTPGTGAAPGADGADGANGNAGRMSSGLHCCFESKYLECPTPAACWGGFDVDACIAACDPSDVACIGACVDKLDAAGAPVGCQSKAPPAGVDCANGQIDI